MSVHVSQSTNFALSVSGDQLFVYTQSYEDPHFIFAASNTWSSTESSTTSLLPVELEGTNAYVTIGYDDNALYNDTNSGSQSDLLAMISNHSSWISSSSQRYDVHGIASFSVTEPSTPDDDGDDNDGDDNVILSDTGAIIILILVCGVGIVGLVVILYFVAQKMNQHESQAAESMADEEDLSVEIANALHK